MNRSMRVARRAQRGVILFVALIVLVAMTLTGIALMRSVDTNVLVAGNLAFRQGATSAGDWGVEAARVFLRNALTASKSSLDLDQANNNYYASWQASLDMTGGGFDWELNTTAVGTDSAGNEVRYVVHRMCQNPGAGSAPATNCIRTAGSSTGSASDGGTKGTVSYSTLALPAPTVIYYRVTVRILGPRNTLSFVQAMLK